MAAEIPIPPVELTARLQHGAHTEVLKRSYLELGERFRRAIERVLPEDWSWDGKTVLDFGCGAGRAIRHLLPLAPECELWGSDIDPRCIEWDRRHLGPDASFVVNDEFPPLPFEDGMFDLVYALSVFTHISDYWAPWLLEMDRVLAPGGRLIATFMGEAMCEPVSGAPFDERKIGMNVYEAGQDWSLGGPMVLHSPWWIEEHWGRLFGIERLLSRGFLENPGELGDDDQGAVVLIKSTDSARPTQEELERINPAESREATALQHDVRHLRAEVAGLRATQAAAAELSPTGREGLAAVRAAITRRISGRSTAGTR